jgi:glycosyltransferase involved in cell wall biosynthesis
MRVSVVATVRNERGSIATLLESLLAQSHRPDEIIIVDGVSTDGTLEILQSFAAANPIIRVISQPCNIATGRNLGIAAASGTHIAITDAGCRVDRDWLEQLLASFLADETVDVVAGNFRFETHSLFEEAVVLATFQPFRDATETARFYPSSRSVAVKKSAWQKAGGYPEWLYAAEDTLFNIRLRQVGCHFAFARNAIVRWRPRTSWSALARQRINFAQGNGRVGIGTSGYIKNLRTHGLALALLIAAFWFPILLAAALGVSFLHVRRNLWPQATLTTRGRAWHMRFRVLAVMEFVRLVSMYGYLLGRWDRLRDASFVEQQQRYMNVASVEELEAQGLA